MASHAKAKKPGWKKPMRKRERQVIQIQGLELDIINLQHEISGLRQARSLLDDRRLVTSELDAGTRSVEIVKQYYRLLSYGFGDALWDEDTRQYVDTNAVVDIIFTADVQVITVGNRVERGRDALKSNMLRIGAVFDLPRVALKESHIEEAAGHVVVAGTTETAGQVTEFTLASQFPHLHFYPKTRAKLLGRNAVAGGRCSYTFDINTGLVVRVEERVDFVSSIGRLLDPDERSRVLFDSNLSMAERLRVTRDQEAPSTIYQL